MYGGSVLACSTRERARCTLAPGGDGLRVTVGGEAAFFQTGADLALRPGSRLNVARAVLSALGVDPATAPAFALEAETDIPMQAGLAGSTALLACLSGAVLAHLGRTPNRYEAAELVRKIEYDGLGVVCGFQDHHMTVFGGLNFLDFRGRRSDAVRDVDTPLVSVEPLSSYLEADALPFVLAHTGVRHHSGTVHSSPRERWLRGEPAVVKAYAEVGELARRAKRALLESDWDGLALLMTRNHALVRDLGGSGEANEALIRAALDGGALAAKLAGAGGGGTILALTLDKPHTVAALEAAGAEAILYPTPSPGLTVTVGMGE